MKNYIKPEVTIEKITVKSPIASLSVNTDAADYSNVQQDTWNTWADLFN